MTMVLRWAVMLCLLAVVSGVHAHKRDSVAHAGDSSAEQANQRVAAAMDAVAAAREQEAADETARSAFLARERDAAQARDQLQAKRNIEAERSKQEEAERERVEREERSAKQARYSHDLSREQAEAKKRERTIDELRKELEHDTQAVSAGASTLKVKPASNVSALQFEEGRWVLALDRDMRTKMLIQVKHSAPAIKDPCGGLECSQDLKCPAGFVSKKFPGHCCAYCVNPNVKVEKEAEGATGKYGGKESAMPTCANVWCFPTLCTKPLSNPTTTNGQCCATCPAL